MMVCLRAENEDSNKIVKCVALLHDGGKPESRDTIPFEAKKPVHSESNEIRNDGKFDGKSSGMQRVMPKSGLKTHFRGHEGLSFYRAIEVVNKLEEKGVLSLQEKKQILTIISLHGTLFDSIKDGKEYKPERVVAKFADNYFLFRDFIQQVKNDSTGRFFASKDGRKSQAFELGKSIYNFGTFEDNKKPITIKNNAPTITMLVGPPAVGKSTWRNENQGDAVVISRDDIMLAYADTLDIPKWSYSSVWKHLEDNNLHKEVDKIEKETFDKAKQAGKNIIVDRTNMSRKSRRKWLANVPKTYKKEAVVFATVYEDIYSRNEKRKDTESKSIPNYIIGNMMRQFMVPMYDEVDEVKWVF